MTAHRLDDLMRRPGMVVIYDGQCPFCAAYVQMLRLRQSVGLVELVDARVHPDLVEDCELQGFPLNDGMLALLAGRSYFGADALILLSQLTTASGLLNTVTAAVMKRPALAKICYPAMRGGRAATLRALGRAKL